jgi:NodT family efflux transporter outer membrane factor (OMF) lipoprotein
MVACAACVHDPATVAHERPLSAQDVGLAGADTSAAPGTIATPHPSGWWHELGDPQLDRLVATALARNPGLAGALARVRSAEQQAAVAGSTRSPQVGLDGDAARTRVSENYLFPPPYGGGTYWDARLGFTLGWQLDFWGRQAAFIEQSSSLATAAALDAASSELLLAGVVVQAYVDYARALELEQLALRGQAQRRELLELTAQRVAAGLDSKVEAKIAEANLEQSALEVTQARLAQQVARNALATLTGSGAAQALELEPPRLDLERSRPVPDPLPADLLARRPDIRAAQARIAAATAGRDAAHATFYPNVNLQAFAGTVAIGLDELFDAGSRQWRAGPAIHLPIFDAGRLRAEYRRAGADLDAAIASYNDAVLRAVREAADQSARMRAIDEQRDAQQRSLAAAEQAHDMALQRYGAGLATQLVVLNAETQVLAARRQRISLLTDRASAEVALIVALGGATPTETLP